jgi:hypothetical protein
MQVNGMAAPVLTGMNSKTSGDLGVVLYGDGASGNFQAQANHLASEDLTKRFGEGNVVVRQTLTRDAFFQALLGVPDGKILELDIFATSVGAGLCLGYKDPTAAQNRERLQSLSAASGTAASSFEQGSAGGTSYQAVLQAETGSVLTDHLVTSPFNQNQSEIRGKFAKGARARLYGCNGGTEGWVYSDLPTQIGSRSSTVPYYWRALNTRNTPKPSIAKALADFLGIPVTATTSLAPVEKFQQDNAEPRPKNEAPILRTAIQHKSLVELTPTLGSLGGRSSVSNTIFKPVGTHPVAAHPVGHPQHRR